MLSATRLPPRSTARAVSSFGGEDLVLRGERLHMREGRTTPLARRGARERGPKTSQEFDELGIEISSWSLFPRF